MPADALSEAALGKKAPNVPLIAALLGLTGLFPLDAFIAALEERFEAKIAAANRKAAEAAFASVTPNAWGRAADKEVA